MAPFEGIHNWRDLGGHKCDDGRVTKSGVLYRCASTDNATASDCSAMTEAPLGIKTILDFRGANASAGRPNLLDDAFPALPYGTEERARIRLEYINGTVKKELASVAGGLTIALFFMTLLPLKLAELLRWLLSPVPCAALPLGRWLVRTRLSIMAFCWCQRVGGMQTTYEKFCTKNPLAVERALKLCVDPGRQPVAFHCQSGKDRTGVTAALLLHAAGVPKDAIVDDYERSHAFALSELHIVHALNIEASVAPPAEWFNADPNREAMFGAPRRTILAWWAQMDSIYGSLDGYLDSLGLDAEWRDEWREQFTE